MGESFLFEAIRLRDDALAEPVAPAALVQAVSAAGWRPDNVVPDEGPAVFRARKGELLARVDLSAEDSTWVVSSPDADLRWSDGRPEEAAQASVLELLRALLQAAPPYVGVSCWPFGPSVPEVYNTSAPFALRQVGSVMFLSERYLTTQLPGVDIATAPARSQEALAGGVLLIADDDLLRSADDGDLDELRAFFGLPRARSS